MHLHLSTVKTVAICLTPVENVLCYGSRVGDIPFYFYNLLLFLSTIDVSFEENFSYCIITWLLQPVW